MREVDNQTSGPTVVGPEAGESFASDWNAGDEPCRIVEVISPAGFESYFREVAEAGGDLERFGSSFPEL